MGIHIQPTKTQCLIGFADAEWTGSLDDKHSSRGYSIFLVQI